MKLVVLGATGPSGLQVMEQAVAAGHDVTAYVRQKGSLPDTVTVTIGEITDVPAMTAAFGGADAVLCCLGVKPGLGALRGVDLMVTATPAVEQAMRAAGARRLVLLSAFGVGASREKASPVAKAVYGTMLSAVFADKQKSEQTLAGSGLDWTVVAPVTLSDGPATGSVTTTELSATPKIGGLPKVSRADVATVMLTAATTGSWTGQTVVVTS